ncbi:hypothetical protein [Aureivirga sp. CE67]|uniref:hypothetical protein n=1 Tax=Aureivirga sp. CE67 TaxID=1788983 RepID=UPI0018C9D0E2|nr:hypothetical protein [Aureivirga sp. CE67]
MKHFFKKNIFALIFIPTQITLFLIMVNYFDNKRAENLRKYHYVLFEDECNCKVKKADYDRGWTTIICEKGDSLLFAVDGLGLYLEKEAVLRKEKNDDTFIVFQNMKMKNYRINYDRNLDSNIVPANSQNR